MEDRSKEELQQIYNDLLEFRKTFNLLNSYGELWPTPMNGKTWGEEKKGFWNKGVTSLNTLIRSEKVKSCEILTLCEFEIKWCQGKKEENGFLNHVGWEFSSSRVYDFGGQSYNLDEMIEATAKVISGNATETETSKVNEILNGIGTDACKPRACIQKEIEDTFAHNNGLISSKSINVNTRA